MLEVLAGDELDGFVDQARQGAGLRERGPDGFVVAFFAHGEFGELWDEVPCLADKWLAARALAFECVFARHFDKVAHGGALAGGLGFGVELHEEVEVLWEAARGDAETACVFLGAVGGGGRQACEVSAYGGKENFQHLDVGGADGEVGDVETVTLVGDAIPGDAIGAELTVAGTGAVRVGNVSECIEKVEGRAALLDRQEPGEAHPRAAKVAETLCAAFVAAGL